MTAAGAPVQVAEPMLALMQPDGMLEDLLDGFETPLRILGELSSDAVTSGCPIAAVYVEGARSSLRMAFAAAAKRAARGRTSPVGCDVTLLGVGDVAVRTCEADALTKRGRVAVEAGGSVFRAEPDAEEVPGAPERGLPHDLLADAGMRQLARGPAFSALLAAALGHHRWVHLKSGRTASMTAPVATCVVSILAGGHAFPRWPMRFAGLLLDEQVCTELARLGWRRIASPGLSEGFEQRACEAMAAAS